MAVIDVLMLGQHHRQWTNIIRLVQSMLSVCWDVTNIDQIKVLSEYICKGVIVNISF